MGQAQAALHRNDATVSAVCVREREHLLVLGMTPSAFRQAGPFIHKMIELTEGARVVSGDKELLAMK